TEPFKKMFGWNKTSEKIRNSGSRTSESLNLGIDDFDLSPGADELTEEDLVNPELLGELRALSTSDLKNEQKSKTPKTSKTSKPVAKPTNKSPKSTTVLPEVDIDALGVQFQNDDDDVEVELTEEDMKDPALLNDLKSLGYQNERNYNVGKSIEQDDQSQFQPKEDQSTIGTSDADSPLEVKLLEENVDILAKYIQQEKLKAVIQSRAGDKKGAMEIVRGYKQLEEKRSQILAKTSKTPSDVAHSKSTAVSKAVENVQPSKPNLTNSELILSIKQRLDQYMNAVNVFKNTNYQRAKEYMNIAKSLQTVIQSLLKGENLPENWVLPGEPVMSEKAPPSSPSSATPKNKAPAFIAPSPLPTKASTSKEKVLVAIDNVDESQFLNEDLTTMSKKDQYEKFLKVHLESQISSCQTISAFYLKCGHKNEAMNFLRYKKAFVADLASLASYQKHDKDMPPFHFKEVTYDIENAFFDLSANDLEICIERAWNLGNKEVNGKDVEAYVCWDIGWPLEGSQGAGNGKGDTSVAKRGMDPEFNWKKIISIERTRPFIRHVERKKATFEVFHYRGFLRKAISLGKAQVKLDPFIKKSEIHDVFELVDNNRRPTGGRLEIRLRMRHPLEKADIITKKERWLIIDEFNTNTNTSGLNTLSSTSQQISSPVSRPGSLQDISSQPDLLQDASSTPIRKTSASDISTLTPKTSSQVSTPVSQKQSTYNVPPVTPSKEAKSTEIDQNELEQAEEELNSVDLMVSSKLLQQESELIDAQIASLQTQQKSVPEDLLDRKSAIQIKTNLMEIQVQTGQLTIDKYMDNVKNYIVNCKKLALIFKKAGRLEEAKKLLSRSKLMEGEVKEIEEAMSGGGMDNE
ncbi:8542_t:CDS:2, partial [Diversispora eburnea]